MSPEKRFLSTLIGGKLWKSEYTARKELACLMILANSGKAIGTIEMRKVELPSDSLRRYFWLIVSYDSWSHWKNSCWFSRDLDSSNEELLKGSWSTRVATGWSRQAGRGQFWAVMSVCPDSPDASLLKSRQLHCFTWMSIAPTSIWWTFAVKNSCSVFF